MAKYNFNKIEDLKTIALNIKKEVEQHEKEGIFGNQNCILCSLAFEMQLRGKNTLPRPVLSPRDIIFDEEKYNSIVLNSKKEKFKNLKELKEIIKEPNSRYYCHVEWKNNMGGHEFLLINLNNQIYVLDGQAGYVNTLEKSDKYFKINYKNSYVERIDDKEINKDLIEANKKKNMTKIELEKDVKYLKRRNMISEEDYKTIIGDSILDSSRSDFGSYFGTINAQKYFEACKNPKMNTSCKNLEKWNKYYRMAADQKLSLKEFEKFSSEIDVLFEESIDDYISGYSDGYEDYEDYNYYTDTDDLPSDFTEHVFLNETIISKLLEYAIIKYRSPLARTKNEIELICQSPESDEVNYLGEDNGWKCYEILTPEAAVKYGLVIGGRSGWCISGGYFDGKEDGGILEEATKFFKKYLRESFETYYFIIGHGTKYAICPEDEKKCVIWDINDKVVSAEDIPDAPFEIKELEPYLKIKINEDLLDEMYYSALEKIEEQGCCVEEILKNDCLKIYNENIINKTDRDFKKYLELVKEKLLENLNGCKFYDTENDYYTSKEFKENSSPEEFDKYSKKAVLECKKNHPGFKYDTFEDIILNNKVHYLRYGDIIQDKCFDLILDEIKNNKTGALEAFKLVKKNSSADFFQIFEIEGSKDAETKISNYFNAELKKRRVEPDSLLIKEIFYHSEEDIKSYSNKKLSELTSLFETSEIITLEYYESSNKSILHIYKNVQTLILDTFFLEIKTSKYKVNFIKNVVFRSGRKSGIRIPFFDDILDKLINYFDK